MTDQRDRDPEPSPDNAAADSGRASVQRTFIHRVLRYVPSPLRDEWVNIGILLYDPNTGERRLRLIEEEAEYTRVRRLRPAADEAVLRALKDHLESRLGAATQTNGNGGPIRSTLRNGQGNPVSHSTDWFQILEKWDATLSNSLQLDEPQATFAYDIDAEMDRIYDMFVFGRYGTATAPANRAGMRQYCIQVFKQARVWDRIDDGVPMAEFTFPEDPTRIDFGYRRNGIRGFVQTIRTRNTSDARRYSEAAWRIADRLKNRSDAEFTAVTDVALDLRENRHTLINAFFAERNIIPVPLDNFAVWVAKLRPMV